MMASKSDTEKASQQTAQTCRFGPEDASGVARSTPFASFISRSALNQNSSSAEAQLQKHTNA
jgi:hypothetical protein